MRIALILGMVFGPLAVVALNIEPDLKAAQSRSPIPPGSIPDNPLRPREEGLEGSWNYDESEEVSAWFQSVRAPLTSPFLIEYRLAGIQVMLPSASLLS